MHPYLSEQIKSIYRYITENLVNEPATHRLKNTIERKFTTISIFPNSGKSIVLFDDNILEEFSNVQKITANNYINVY